MPKRKLTGDCSIDCLDGCAYPGQFSECDLGLPPDVAEELRDNDEFTGWIPDLLRGNYNTYHQEGRG